MARVLVTGGAGFIGSHLVEALVRRGDEVVVLDNFSTGRRENLKPLLKQVRLARADVRDFDTVRRRMQGVSLVFHLAAVSSVPLSVDEPLDTFDANLRGTWNVLEAARLAGVRRVVFISSASVYGADCPVPFREDMPLKGSSPYATSKLVGEQLCDLYLRLYGLQTVALRLFSVYGPRQNPHSQYANVIPAFATCVLHGKTPTIYGTGEQTRDFVFVKDVVRALLQAARRRAVVGQVVNVGSGQQTSVKELLRLVQEVLGTDIPPRHAPLKPGDDPRTCADTTRARTLLGLNRLTPFRKGLRITCRWFKEYYGL